MSQECPHCGVDDFGLWDLFILTTTYSDSLECKNCGGLVCNSGWSEFLTLLTIAVLVLLDFVFLFPLAPEWVFFLSLIALIPLPVMLLARPVPAVVPLADRPPFTPDLNNDKAIIVSGWDDEELGRALYDFNSRSALRIDIEKRSETLYRLTFPEDISVFEFVVLVNYLNYPIDLASPERQITIAGTTTLNSTFAGIPAALLGKNAICYVPENDEDYDVVYLQTPAGDTFSMLLNQESGWRRVSDPRLSDQVKAIT